MTNEGRTSAPNIVVRAAKDGTPFYEAKWRVQPAGVRNPRQVKRRLGPAWVTATPDGGWKKRAGRVPDGWLDERAAHVEAAARVQEHAEREASEQQTELDRLTVRELAAEWLDWLENVRSASPATIRDYRYLLREPGEKDKRGDGVATGRIMKAFGERLAGSVSSSDVSAWLRRLDREGLSPRNVNKHREVLHSIFTYATRTDTYALLVNPVTVTDRRRVPQPAKLDYYEPAEVEALAVAAAEGPHRKTPNYQGRASTLSDEELQVRRRRDEQNGELFRVLLYTGLRIGEARALRWECVALTDDLEGGVLDIRTAVSANEEKAPKSYKPRTVPIPRPAAEALARLAQRPDFISPRDYVFCTRTGGRLDISSIRRHYKAAREAAGLREIKLHGLRHAAGSIMAQGAGLLVARDVLGHAHISTTNRYLAGKTDDRAIAVMNAAYGVPDGTR
jgi:integrase